jgi:hypothetical protein
MAGRSDRLGVEAVFRNHLNDGQLSTCFNSTLPLVHYVERVWMTRAPDVGIDPPGRQAGTPAADTALSNVQVWAHRFPFRGFVDLLMLIAFESSPLIADP